MSKAHYILNKDTLEFVKQRNGIFKSFRHFLRIFGAVAAIAVFINFLYFAIFGFPSNEIERSQNSILLGKYDILNSEIQHYGIILSSLKAKDDSVYRAVLQMSIVPNEMRRAGTGGSLKYNDVSSFRNNNTVIEVSQNIDLLRRQLIIQQQSFKEIFSHAIQYDQKLNSIPSILPIAIKSIIRFSDHYGIRRDPFLGISRMHEGMDICGPLGTSIYATAKGVVTIAGREMGYGKMVEIDHGYGFKTRYGHLSEINVQVGQEVARGTTIGELGNTGRSTGPHIHYEVRINNIPVNPIHFFSLNLTAEEYDNLLDALLVSE